MSAMGYVLGVDGGNTKTDYLLHDMEGRLVAHLRVGTCSHEALGLDGAYREMDGRITELLQSAGVDRSEIVAAAFGLAGIDQPLQKAALTEIVRKMGFENSVAANDSFLGIKAGSESGIGVCSINGTGTASGGIDAAGNSMQVGGIGPFSGDEAGGSYIATVALRAVYDEIFRFGEKTVLTPRTLALFGTETPDDFHCDVSTKYQYGTQVKTVEVLQLLFAAADEGDPVAVRIVRNVADALARSAGGCAMRLRFDGPVPVILIGSVWTKGRYQPMIDHFKAQFEAYTKKACTLQLLSVPPAAGSILWALELATGKVPAGALRARVIEETSAL